MSRRLEYNADGAQLNVQQRQEFYETMKEGVWKVLLPWKSIVFNGVCVRKGKHKYIITIYWDDNIHIEVYSPDGTPYQVEHNHRDKQLGLSLLVLKNIGKPGYVKRISSNIDIDVGTTLYTIVHGPNMSLPFDPMDFMGKTGFAFYSTSSDSNHLNRTPASLLEKCSSSDTPLLKSLDNDMSLIQVENLQCANMHRDDRAGVGYQSRLRVDTRVRMGLLSAPGSPVFNARGRLVGIVAFELSNWNIVIPSSYIPKLIMKMEESEDFKELSL